MKTYEITYMTVLEEGNDAKSIASFLAGHKAKITSVHPWGNRRKLTYHIKKQDQAFFTTVVFDVEPSAIQSLQREIQLSNDVLRSLIVEFEPGIFHRSNTTDEKNKTVEKETPSEALGETTTPEPATSQPDVSTSPTEKTESQPESTPEVEPKPKKRRATAKPSAQDEKSLDEKLDALLNEDITK